MALSKNIVVSVAVAAALLVVWWIVAIFRLIDPIVLPPPQGVGWALLGMLKTTEFPLDIGVTLGRVGVAIVLAGALGVPVGLYLGYRKTVYSTVEAPLHALRSIPASALFPLLLIVVGVGNAAIIVLAAYPSLLVVLVNSANGASLANKRRLYQADILGLSAVEKIREVLFFEALPNIFDGLRTAVSYALVLVIAVEMFIGVGDRGLGRRIYDYQVAYRIPEMYAAILIAGSLGVLLNWVLTRLERRLLVWLPNAHEESSS